MIKIKRENMKKKVNPFDELFDIYFANGNRLTEFMSRNRYDYDNFKFMFAVPINLMPEFLTMSSVKTDEIIGMCILFAREMWEDENK